MTEAFFKSFWYCSIECTANFAGDINRCPEVIFDDVIPSTSIFTVFTPSSAERIHKMECKGRTHFIEPEPQRIDFAQGKLFIVLVITSEAISSANRPSFSITAKYVFPFLSSLISN